MFPSVILSESLGANATEDESKDLEKASSAMPGQGVPNGLAYFLGRASHQRLRATTDHTASTAPKGHAPCRKP